MRSRSKPNGKAPPVTISLEAPRPLLDEGEYAAVCADVSVAWSRRWKKWIARLVMEPADYFGRPYTGVLCRFFQLGSNPQRPHAGQQSEFRKLLVRLNGAQPTNSQADLALFVGRTFQIQVVTVKGRHKIRDGKPAWEPFAPEDWYSVVRTISPAEHEHTNTATRQHTNTATHQPINTSTLVNTATPLTQQHTRPEATEGLAKPDQSLGDRQQTHNDRPDRGADSNSAPRAQLSACPKCSSYALYRERDGTVTCETCEVRRT